ncbi:MAG: DUF89 family protein [Campylobacterales bacterium]|nr:DUF89 family protein [Campylobacterales bacterium]
MKLTNECILCILNQTLNVCKTLNIDEDKTKEVLDEIASFVKEMKFDQTPPYVASFVYQKISKILNIEDLYSTQKELAIIKAKTLFEYTKDIVQNANDKLLFAIKASIAGNVLDLATPTNFCLDEEISKIFSNNFEIDNHEELKNDILIAKKIVYLADNAGENIFDNILLKTIKSINPTCKIFYATRSKPIINDITYHEALKCGHEEFAEVVDSGVDSPGFIFEKSTDKFLKLFEDCDFVISKGMGNFETLESYKDKKIYFLFKVKCNIVATHINKNVGDIICMKNI